MVVFPEPVAPTSAILRPAPILRLKSSMTRFSGTYEKFTWQNSISPFTVSGTSHPSRRSPGSSSTAKMRSAPARAVSIWP